MQPAGDSPRFPSVKFGRKFPPTTGWVCNYVSEPDLLWWSSYDLSLGGLVECRQVINPPEGMSYNTFFRFFNALKRALEFPW